MSDLSFGSSLGSMGGGYNSGSNKSMSNSSVFESVKQQIAVANAQELLSKMSDKCFKKCINKPGTSLDSSEQKCVAMCMDRYMEAWNLVSQTYTERLNEEHSNLGGSGLM